MLGEIGHVTGQKLLEDSSFLEKKDCLLEDCLFRKKFFSYEKLMVCFFFSKDYHPDRQDIQKSMTAFKNLSVSN